MLHHSSFLERKTDSKVNFSYLNFDGKTLFLVEVVKDAFRYYEMDLACLQSLFLKVYLRLAFHPTASLMTSVLLQRGLRKNSNVLHHFANALALAL